MPVHWTISHPARLVVAASDDSYGKAAVFAAGASVDRPLKVFRELHAARQWLDACQMAPATSA